MPMSSANAKIRKIVATTAAAAAASVPLVIATSVPAEASTSRNGCTVTPLKPTSQRVLVFRDGAWRYDTRVTFSNRVTCVGNRIIRVIDRQLEQDAGVNQFVGSSDTTRTFSSGATVTLSTTRWLSVINTETGADEYLHSVRFRVASINQLSAWTADENSLIQPV